MLGIITSIIPFGKKLLDLIYAKRDNEELRKQLDESKKELKREKARSKRFEKMIK